VFFPKTLVILQSLHSQAMSEYLYFNLSRTFTFTVSLSTASFRFLTDVNVHYSHAWWRFGRFKMTKKQDFLQEWRNLTSVILWVIKFEEYKKYKFVSHSLALFCFILFCFVLVLFYSVLFCFIFFVVIVSFDWYGFLSRVKSLRLISVLTVRKWSQFPKMDVAKSGILMSSTTSFLTPKNLLLFSKNLISSQRCYRFELNEDPHCLLTFNTLKVKRTQTTRTGPSHLVSLSPDNNVIVTTSNTSIQLWNASDGKLLKEIINAHSGFFFKPSRSLIENRNVTEIMCLCCLLQTQSLLWHGHQTRQCLPLAQMTKLSS
jgi:hypothetical protein